jgi:hypothetical protein
MPIDEMVITGDEEVPDVSGEGTDTNGSDGESQTEENGTENTAEDDKAADPRDAHGWRQRVDKLTKQRTEARSKYTELEAKHKAAQQELESLRGTVGDELVMNAAQTAGVLPRFIDKAGAQVLSQAAKLERDLAFFETHIGGEDYTFQVGEQTYTGRQAAQFAATVRNQLRQVSGRADAIRQKALDRHNRLVELGEAAEKAGWKPGAKATTTATGTTRNTPTPPPLPGGGGERRAPSREPSVPEIDFSKIQTREDRLKALTEQAQRDYARAG